MLQKNQVYHHHNMHLIVIAAIYTKVSDLKARLALLSASVVAWLLSFLSSAEATRASRHRATTFVIHILSDSESSCSSL